MTTIATPCKIRFMLNNMFTFDMNGDPLKRYNVEEEAELFTALLNTRPKSADGHLNGKDVNTIIWENFNICIDTIASKREYRTVRNLELLEHQYFRFATFTMSHFPEEYIIEEATPEAAAEYIESATLDDWFLCHNELQVAFAMELHHLRQTNKGGFGEVFRKCEICGRYFLTTDEIYCSDACKAEAKARQMKRVNEDPKTIYLKLIRDRYNMQIKRAETAGNDSLAERKRKERDDFQKERKRKKKELPEDQYIDWLKQQHEETKEK